MLELRDPDMASSTADMPSATALSNSSARVSRKGVSSYGSTSTETTPRSMLSASETEACLSTSRMNSITKLVSPEYLFLKSFSHPFESTSEVGFSTVTVIPAAVTVDVPAPGLTYSSGSIPASSIVFSMYGTAL